MRTFEIARALAPHHAVHWIEGGRPVPHTACPGLSVCELPRIERGPDGRLQGLDTARPIAAIMQERAARLLDAVERVRPQVLLVEYFPFSKWELADELLPAIRAARHSGAKVLCSLRDVVPQTRFETAGPSLYPARVTQLLNRHFDGLLIHADPTLTRLEEHFPGVADILPPVHYTGLVSKKLTSSPGVAAEIQRVTGGRPFVLASAGGGAGGRALIAFVTAAWRQPRLANGRLLVICAGLGWPEVRTPPAPRRDEGIAMLPFRVDFLHWRAAADLSLSQCGYNTAANLLETGTPAIVMPSASMSDQPARAGRLAELGLVELFDPRTGAEGLANAIARASRRGHRVHSVDLGGAERTRSLIEMLP